MGDRNREKGSPPQWKLGLCASPRGGEAFGAGSAHTGQRHSHHDVPHRAQHHSNDPLHTVLLSKSFKTRSVFRRVNIKRKPDGSRSSFPQNNLRLCFNQPERRICIRMLQLGKHSRDQVYRRHHSIRDSVNRQSTDTVFRQKAHHRRAVRRRQR